MEVLIGHGEKSRKGHKRAFESLKPTIYIDCNIDGDKGLSALSKRPGEIKLGSGRVPSHTMLFLGIFKIIF